MWLLQRWLAIATLAAAVLARPPATALDQERNSTAELPDPLAGRLRIEGSAFRDDRGPALPLYAHG